MSHAWHRKNPTLFDQEKREVEAAFPQLHFHVVNDVVFIRGSFPIIHEGKELDRYLIEIELPGNYPESLPIVRETGGQIPCTPDHHINSEDGTACVMFPDERWSLWPKGSSLLAYLNGPLRNFFLGQSAVDAGSLWPFGEWGHGAKGIVEYYSMLLKTDDVQVITGFLELFAKKKTKGHWPCPCGSGKHLRDCHHELVRDLREKIPRRYAEESLNRLKRR